MNGWRKSSHSFSNGNCAEVAAWRKSSHSGASNCAEAVQDGTVVRVRDSMDRGGPVLAVSGDAWTRFLAGIKGDRRPAFPDLE